MCWPLFGSNLGWAMINIIHLLVFHMDGEHPSPLKGCEGAGFCAAPRAPGFGFGQSLPPPQGQGKTLGSILCRPKGKKKASSPTQSPPPSCHEHAMRVPCPTRGRGAAREHRTPRAQKTRKGPMVHTNVVRRSYCLTKWTGRVSTRRTTTAVRCCRVGRVSLHWDLSCS